MYKNSIYDKDKIDQLALAYAETEDATIFNELLEELKPMIKIQLGKNYSSIKEIWEDLESHTIMRLWLVFGEKPERIRDSSTRIPSILFYQRIRTILNRHVEKLIKSGAYDFLDKSILSYDQMQKKNTEKAMGSKNVLGGEPGEERDTTNDGLEDFCDDEEEKDEEEEQDDYSLDDVLVNPEDSEQGGEGVDQIWGDE